MTDRGVPTAIARSAVHWCRVGRPLQSRRAIAPTAMGTLAPSGCVTELAARQRPLPDGENCGGEISLSSLCEVKMGTAAMDFSLSRGAARGQSYITLQCAR